MEQGRVNEIHLLGKHGIALNEIHLLGKHGIALDGEVVIAKLLSLMPTWPTVCIKYLLPVAHCVTYCVTYCLAHYVDLLDNLLGDRPRALLCMAYWCAAYWVAAGCPTGWPYRHCSSGPSIVPFELCR